MSVEEAQQAREVLVDPFAFFPGVASRIAGIGGNTPSHDHNYVFHTPYLEAAPGPSRFIIQFHGLEARIGALWLRVHMLSLEPDSRAVMVNSDRIQLNRLIQTGGRWEIRFEGFVGMSFGLYAGIQGETDARADDVQVWFDRPLQPGEVPEIATDVRSTRFGSDEPMPVAMMLSTDQPRLTNPATQIATAPQLYEPICVRWAADFDLSPDPITRWRQLFVVQTLHRYGMINAGARGLAITDGNSALVPPLQKSLASLETLNWSGAGADTDLGLDHHELPVGVLPSNLVNFDFAWSEDVWRPFETATDAIGYLERVMATVRPRGILVHTGGFLVGWRSSQDRLLLSRADVERLLLVLISRGHEVAQFRLSDREALRGSDGSTGAIGIIVRKAASLV